MNGKADIMNELEFEVLDQIYFVESFANVNYKSNLLFSRDLNKKT
jgi:hypothetical protein